MKKIHDKTSNYRLNNKKSRKQFFLLVIAIFTLSYYISNNLYQLMLIQGNSMSPAYHNLQLVIIDRHKKNYRYGDVIAFQCEGLNTILVKRVAACPGDTVVIEQGTLYVNGEISVVYSDEKIFEYAGILENPIQLKMEQYIVIGDNISESKDSRYDIVGYVSKFDILGNVITIPIISKTK